MKGRTLLCAILAILTVGCTGFTKSHSYKPRKVGSAAELARQVIPGWERAEQQGLIVPLGLSEAIPNTKATIKLESAWYSPQHTYVLYTVSAPPEVKPLMATNIMGFQGAQQLDGQRGPNAYFYGYGGFSPAGFHQVMVLAPIQKPMVAAPLQLEIRQWFEMTPQTEDLTGRGVLGAGDLTFTFSVKDIHEEVEAYPLERQGTWLGRTFAVEKLDVGVGETRVQGWLEILPGESRPQLGALLLYGEQARNLVGFEAEPEGKLGRYHFTARFEPPDHWPARVRLQLNGIHFESDKTLEAQIPWRKYNSLKERAAPAKADQVEVPFYDGGLHLAQFYDAGRGFGFELLQSKNIPHVELVVGQVELVGPGGEAHTNMQTGSGDIGNGKDGVSFVFDDLFSPTMMAADQITFRYHQPQGVMVLKEDWDLLAK